MNKKSWLRDMVISVGCMSVTFCVSLTIDNLFQTRSLIPTIFVLGVFLIALSTKGYFWGIAASLSSVLAVNFAFTFPDFKFNFSIPENLVSAIIMMIITTTTSALTTKVKAQEKLRADSQREKLRANLLRAVSHDLRTPLTTITGATSAIIENYDRYPKEQQLQLLRGIREDAQWLVRMVENLLSVTRIDGQGVKLIKTETVLEELIDAVLVKFRKSYPEQPVQVTIPEDFIAIAMDAMLIQQVIVNLLENAVEHADGMTRLELAVERQGTQAVFYVRDNGCGIPKERMEQLFTGYLGQAQSDSARRNMGIGLSVCASIIKAHGGTISARNLPTGGAEFRFTLEMED